MIHKLIDFHKIDEIEIYDHGGDIDFDRLQSLIDHKTNTKEMKSIKPIKNKTNNQTNNNYKEN